MPVKEIPYTQQNQNRHQKMTAGDENKSILQDHATQSPTIS